ncbi:MAG TPA: hypothetical protein DCZ43_08190, partial [candidate division Zixibacteria bacterium]|nr:hypothetical protein [candidate division Zixibacteria bacterium]
IVADVSLGNISILLNAGNGTFLQRVSYNVIPYAISVVADDFNNDGHMDIASAGFDFQQTSTCVVLMNNGEGQFRDTLRFSLEDGISSIRAGDLNDDGRSDITLVGGSLHIFLNHGGNRFQESQSILVDGESRSISICDLNGDTLKDLAVVDYYNSKVYTFHNMGESGLIIHDTLQAARGPRWLTSGDFDFDGDIDLAVANKEGSSVSLFTNTGTGDFLMPPLIDLPVDPIWVICANLNDDEYDDLLIVTSYDSVATLINDGNLNFIRRGIVHKNGTLYKGNFNDNGAEDFFFVSNDYTRDTCSFSFYINDGNGFFNPGSQINMPYYQAPHICISDINGDNVSDIILGGNYDSLSIFLGNPDGIFNEPYQLHTLIGYVGFFLACDLDLDGDNDLVIGNDSLAIFRNNGNGVFEWMSSYVLPSRYYYSPFGIDVDENSDPDLIVISEYHHTYSILRNDGNFIFRDGGTFNLTGFGTPTLAADVNSDGKTDLILSKLEHFGVTPLINQGNGTFQSTVGYGTDYYRSLSCGDLNGDGVFDLIYSEYATGGNRNRIGIMLNRSVAQSISENQNLDLPKYFSISQNYPNPFNAQTTIRYTLPTASDVSIDIFDITGRKIETIISGRQDAGEYEAVWNAADLASGIYFYKLKAGEYSKTEKCILLK